MSRGSGPTVKRIFQPSLLWSSNHPRIVVLSSALLLIGAGIALSRTGRAFLPEFNEGILTVSAVTLPGTSLADSDSLGRGLERVL